MSENTSGINWETAETDNTGHKYKDHILNSLFDYA